MKSAALLRTQIERSLEHKYPSALTPAPKTIRDVAPLKIARIDAILGGGFPIGAITEITGQNCSGRTSLALTFIARCTQEGSMCAWVDSSDTLDPESAAAAGIVLSRLLWVRCGTVQKEHKPWTALDQALRAIDLLLQVGGFKVILLDLGDIAEQFGYRIPLATWFRFRQAADRTRCCLLVLGKRSYAQSSAGMVVDCSLTAATEEGGTVLAGSDFQFSVRRERFTQIQSLGRKPPVSSVTADALWSSRRLA